MDHAQQCAKFGLKVENARIGKRNGTFLRIAGRRCQLIPTRRLTSNPSYPRSRSRQLYLPRNDWPEFLIYIDAKDNEPIFYVVPSGDLDKDTSGVLTATDLEKYRDAWGLLKDVPAGARTRIRHRQISPEQTSVLQAAKTIGLSASLVRRADGLGRGTPYYQRQIEIEGIRCQVMTAPRCSSRPAGISWSTVHLKVPKTDQSKFVIYVISPPDGEVTNYVILPAGVISKATSRSLYGDWAREYLDAWHLITEHRSK